MGTWLAENEPLWAKAASYLNEWKKALADFGIRDSDLMPSGLCAGGAKGLFSQDAEHPGASPTGSVDDRTDPRTLHSRSGLSCCS